MKKMKSLEDDVEWITTGGFSNTFPIHLILKVDQNFFNIESLLQLIEMVPDSSDVI